MNAVSAIITEIYRQLNHQAKQKAIMSPDIEELGCSQNVNADGPLSGCISIEENY